MQYLRRRLRPLTWIVIVAMLGLGLLPGVSHALAWAGGADAAWAQVCTTGGLARLSPGDSPAGPGGLPAGPAVAAMEHCPYCALGTPAAALPPAPLQPWLAPDAEQAASAALRLQPVVPAPWATAQPRAPPARC